MVFSIDQRFYRISVVFNCHNARTGEGKKIGQLNEKIESINIRIIPIQCLNKCCQKKISKKLLNFLFIVVLYQKSKSRANTDGFFLSVFNNWQYIVQMTNFALFPRFQKNRAAHNR